MVSSVKQSATGEAPVGRPRNRKITLNVKEVKAIQDEKTMLEKYQADSEKLTNLLSIPQYFELDIYTTSRQESNLQALLDKMGQIMSKHTDRDILETCAKTLEYLCSEGSATYTRYDMARSNVIDHAINKYKDAIDEWSNLIAGEELPNEDEIYTIIISLKVVSILFSCHNLNPWDLFDSLYQDIEESKSKENPGRGLPNEALAYCIEACYFSLTWGLYYLENQCESSSVPSGCAELKTNLHKYINACCELTRDGPTQQIQESAYQSVCDLLIIFSDQLSTNESEHIRILEYKSALDEQLILNNFVQHYVFSLKPEECHDETRIEELHKKRNFLASYCKLIVYNIIPTKSAAGLLKHYVREFKVHLCGKHFFRVAEGTPKRNIQLSNIVERRIFKNDDAVMSTPNREQGSKDKDNSEKNYSESKTPTTPKRRRPSKQKDNDLSDEDYPEPKTLATPKRGRSSKQKDNDLSDEDYPEPKTLGTPKRGRPSKHKDNELSDENNLQPKTPKTRKVPANKQTSPEASQMTPSQKLKQMRSGSLKPTIDNRQVCKTDRRKSDLQIARERLHVSVVPKSLPCRETEFLNIYTFLEGKIQDQCGGCMYVSGVPGTGKTATVTGVIRELQRVSEEDRLPEFEFIEINGMRLTEPRQAYVQIYRQLTGKTVSWEHAHSLLEKRFTTPAPRRTTTVLLVDELDILCNRRQDVVYNLLDWPTKSAARLVVVTVANTMDLPERLLMGKVTSRLGLTRLTFQPYSHKQLQEIVIGRLCGSEAFKGDAVQLVARKVAAVSGDARRALDICRRAIEIADAQPTEPKIVNMMHVQQALSEMISSAKVLAIKKCSRLEQIFLQAIVAEVNRTGVEETNFMGVYSQIETISAFMGAPVPTPGNALRICSKLGAERLIICEHSRTDIFQKILLNVSMDDIHYALKVDTN